MSAQVDPTRIRTLTAGNFSGECVLYVMGREQRVSDNWALLHAVELANTHGVPVLVLFAIGPMFLSGTARHNHWLIESLKDVFAGLRKLKIPFHVRTGDWVEVVTSFAGEYKAGAVVFDHNPLQPIRGWRDEVAKKLSTQVYEVDAHNIVPVWVASDKQEFAAYTFRPKINKLLKSYLVEYPKLTMKAKPYTLPAEPNWQELSGFRSWETDAPVLDWITPGEQAAKKALQVFLEERLSGYAERRNDPVLNWLSHLSPYLRWGNLSAQRVVLAVNSVRGVARADKEAFLEELIVRRELSDNFVFYNQSYNKVEGAHAWAQETIKEHAKDKREYLYSYEEFAVGKTHDDLWNAAQAEMVTTGKMHGYMRMYWAKKILEWTPDAQTAIDYALKLNDTYELDGRDSNGVVGVMWSICGVHDRAWTERPVFGKIRYMNFNGAKRKFDVEAYIEKHLGQPTLLETK